MKNETLGGYSSISAFVEAKMRRLKESEPGFASLFEIMFSEGENILYERSSGYRVVRTSYGEARENIRRRVPALWARLGPVPGGSVVGLYMGNSLEWIELFWTILYCGFRPLLMNARLDRETLSGALADCGAAAVISDGPEFDLPTLSPEDLAPGGEAAESRGFGTEVLVMSSGTSAHVKLCAYTAEEFRLLIADSAALIRACPALKKHYEGQLKLLAFLPFYHVFGLIAMYLWFGFFSRTFVHLNDLSPQTIVSTVRRHKVTHIFAVPLFWETVYAEAMREIRSRGPETAARLEQGLRLSRKLGDLPGLGDAFTRTAFREVRENLFGESISFCITGGSEIRREVLEFFNAIGYPLADGYGMTEIGITSVELSGKRSVRSAGTVGGPLASVEYRISDAGELLVRGRSLARYVIEDGVRRENRGDWFPTGDLAERVGEAYRILGRRDDLIVGPDGENLNPNLIEPKFDGVPGVKRVCLVSGEGGAVLLAQVGRRLPAERLEEAKAALRQRIGETGLAGRIGRAVLTEAELIPEGEFKLNRARLKADWAAGRLAPAAPAAPAPEAEGDGVYRRVAELFAAALALPPEEISPETDFFLDGGGSSLDYFALVTRLREEFSVEFPTGEDGRSLSTPGALSAFVRQNHVD